MKIIHYICQYNNHRSNRDLLVFPSSLTKIDYVKGALKEANYKIVLFSVAEGNISNCKFINSTQVQIDSQESHIYINTFGRSKLIFKVVSRLLMFLQLLYYLFFKVKKGETVLFYHSMVIVPIVSFFRLLSNKSIYFEVEESFAAAYGQSQYKIDKECRYWHNASGYICVNDIIAEKSKLKKNVAVCYGDYKTKVIPVKAPPKDKIQILYAGVIEKEGTDAFIAAETAAYLNREYCVNILGYGEDANIFLLKKRIEEVNSQLGYEGVVYHGCLHGRAYIDFMYNCHIGLTTRVLLDSLSDYTFPSKTLVYLCNNLIPVCSPISCIKKSAIRDYIYFCDDITPKSVAQTILTIDLTRNVDYTNILSELDKNFVLKLKEVFE